LMKVGIVMAIRRTRLERRMFSVRDGRLDSWSVADIVWRFRECKELEIELLEEVAIGKGNFGEKSLVYLYALTPSVSSRHGGVVRTLTNKMTRILSHSRWFQRVRFHGQFQILLK
jgi:hypothetical protein